MQEGGAKPDFLDLDGDGNKEEPMKKAAQDKEEMREPKVLGGFIRNLSKMIFKRSLVLCYENYRSDPDSFR